MSASRWLTFASHWLMYSTCWLNYATCWLNYAMCWFKYSTRWLNYSTRWFNYSTNIKASTLDSTYFFSSKDIRLPSNEIVLRAPSTKKNGVRVTIPLS